MTRLRTTHSFYFFFLLLSALAFPVSRVRAQQSVKKTSQFPLTRLWDSALGASQRSHRPVLVFDIDMVDSNTQKFRDKILADTSLQNYLSQTFELAVNDFSTDPPPSVGFDSLRHLGLQLSGLEKTYHIVVRPTVIILRPDSSEIDRIVSPENLNAAQFRTRLEEILAGKNTMESFMNAYYRDTTSILAHIALVDKFEEHSLYDSVIKHLDVLRTETSIPELRQKLQIRYSYLKLQMEGDPVPLKMLMSSLGSSPNDSLLHDAFLHDLLTFYENRKTPGMDSTEAYFNELLSFYHRRDPNVLNDYAWQIANYGTDLGHGMSLVNEAIRIKGDDANFYDTRALLKHRSHDLKAALADEEEALKIARPNPEDSAYFKQKVEAYQKELYPNKGKDTRSEIIHSKINTNAKK